MCGPWLRVSFSYQRATVVDLTHNLDGIGELFIDGTNMTSPAKRFRNTNLDYPNPYDRLFFDQVSNGTGPGPYYVSYGPIVIDDENRRVYLGDTPQLTTCTVVEPQIQTAWASGP